MVRVVQKSNFLQMFRRFNRQCQGVSDGLVKTYRQNRFEGEKMNLQISIINLPGFAPSRYTPGWSLYCK